MKCPQCGSEVSGRFCANCGARVEGADVLSQSMGPGSPLAGATNPPNATDLDPGNPAYAAVSAPPDAGETHARADDNAAAAKHPLGGVGDAQAQKTWDQHPQETAVEGEHRPLAGEAYAGAGVESESPSAGGSAWAQELGVPDDGSFQSRNIVPVPPRVQEALAPLEQFGRQRVTWLGALLLVIGSFFNTKTVDINLQIISSSASGNLWDQSGFWAATVLLMALLSAGLAYIWDFRWLWITGGVTLLALLAAFLDSFSGGSPGVSVHPSYGWIVLFPGVLLILAAAAMRGRKGEPDGDAMMYINGLMNRPG